MSKQNAVWEVVKHLKDKTGDGVVVDAKYTYVCVSVITSVESGEVGADVDRTQTFLLCHRRITI